MDSVVYAIFFSERILPFVSEQVLLVWNLLLLAIVWPLSISMPVLFLLFCIPSVATLALALFPWRLNRFWKFLFYVWFMVLVAWVGVAQVRWSVLAPFFDESRPLRMPLPEAFFSGMAFLFTGVYLVHLFFLLPVPGKHQSLRDRLKEWREQAHLLITRFADDQLRLSTTCAVIAIVGGTLLVNGLWQWMPQVFLINLFIILAPWVLSRIAGFGRGR